MSFRIHLWPTFFCVIGLLILGSLGTWQLTSYLDAADFEERRDARIDDAIADVDDPTELSEGDYDFRRIRVTGRFSTDRLFLIKHRVHDGHPGYWVVRPLEWSGDDGGRIALPVNLGWVPIEDGRQLAEAMLDDAAGETTTVAGLLHVVDDVVADDDFRDRLQSGDDARGVVELETYDIDAINDTAGDRSVGRPLVLTRSPDDTDADLPVASYNHITDPYLTAETHFGYMLTWYLLALALIAIWVTHGLGHLTSRSYDETDRDQ